MYLTVREIINKIEWKKSPHSLFKISKESNLTSVLRSARIDFKINEFDNTININIYNTKFKNYISDVLDEQIKSYKKKKSEKPPLKVLEYLDNKLEQLMVSKLLFEKLTKQDIWIDSVELFKEEQLNEFSKALNLKTKSRKIIFSNIKNLKYKFSNNKIFLNIKDEYTSEFIEIFKNNFKTKNELLETYYFKKEEIFEDLLEKINELKENSKFLFELNKLIGKY